MTTEAKEMTMTDVYDPFSPAIRTVNLDDANAVTIRKFTTEGRQKATSKASSAVQDAQGQRITVDGALLRLEMVKECAVSWEGPWFKDRPLTPANIAQLDPAIFDQVAAACDELNAGLEDATKKA